jgi:hypothetical protein
MSPTRVPTSSESDSQGNNKCTNFVLSHEIDESPVDLNISCAEIENNLLTSLVLDDQATDWYIRCVQVTEKTSVLSAPTTELVSSVDLSTPPEIISDENESCDLIFGSDLNHIKLVSNNEVLARLCQANSLFSVLMDPPISLSHARNKIAEVTCLKSAYVSDFIFNLVGVYNINNAFMVHKIYITCDELSCLMDDKSMSMLNHFDMTSSIDIHPISNNLLQNRLFQHDVVRNLEILNFNLSVLGWFSDKCFTLHGNINMCFTYTYKQSCATCFWTIGSYLMSYYVHILCSPTNVQSGRGVKKDNIYIYHVHTLSLFSVCLQNKHRRGCIYFQKKEDDMDINTPDRTICSICKYISQVISTTNIVIYYYLYYWFRVGGEATHSTYNI